MTGVAGMKPPEHSRRSGVDSLLSVVDATRGETAQRLDPRRRSLMGQFLTPASVAAFMAGMFEGRKPVLRVLDPGAGVGSLSAAFVDAMCRRSRRPEAIELTAYEIDPTLIHHLRTTLDLCRAASEEAGIRFEGRIISEDFLEAGVRILTGDLFAGGTDGRFDCAILNAGRCNAGRC